MDDDLRERAFDVFMDLFENVPEFRAILSLANAGGGAVVVYLLKSGELKMGVILEPEAEGIRDVLTRYIEEGADDTLGFVYYIPTDENVDKIDVTVLPNPPKLKEVLENAVNEIVKKVEQVVGR